MKTYSNIEIPKIRRWKENEIMVSINHKDNGYLPTDDPETDKSSRRYEADYIICLPAASATTIGTVITGQVGANGFELRVQAAQAGTVYLNGVTTNVEAAIPANSTFEVRCIDATHWILKAWTALGAEITAIVPDAI